MNATKTATPGGTDECVNLNLENDCHVESPSVKIQTHGEAPEQGQPTTTQRQSRRERAKFPILLKLAGASAVLALVAYGSFRWWTHGREWVKTDNAYVCAQIHQISSRVTGTVQEVLVNDNQAVKAGEVVARLDRADFELRRNQAKAQVAQARAQAQQVEAQIAQATAQVAQQQARTTKAQQDLGRAETLYNRSGAAISKQELDAARAEFDASTAALRAAESALASARAGSAAAEALEQVAHTSLQDADLQLSYTELRAPAAGRIGRKNLEVGNRVQAGQALLALVEPQSWVVANFKETQLANMRSGQSVKLCLDALPGVVLAGKIDSIAPASGAQFALLPPDNATGNFTKIVQRIPVKITFSDRKLSEFENLVAAGMSAVVEVKVR